MTKQKNQIKMKIEFDNIKIVEIESPRLQDIETSFAQAKKKMR
jgi:hypothetical protein